MCVDFNPAEVHAAPSRPSWKIFQTTECRVAFKNESFSLQQKKPKILGYKDTLFRL